MFVAHDSFSCRRQELGEWIIQPLSELPSIGPVSYNIISSSTVLNELVKVLLIERPELCSFLLLDIPLVVVFLYVVPGLVPLLGKLFLEIHLVEALFIDCCAVDWLVQCRLAVLHSIGQPLDLILAVHLRSLFPLFLEGLLLVCIVVL